MTETLLSPEEAMTLAIEVAKKGIGRVSPNPLVGCVVVDKNHHFLASGFHECFGGAHAEINALRKIKKEKLSGSYFYVTLEPCAHEGKTPSCAKVLSELPIKKVIYGLIDPNPLVQGKGISILENLGIETEEWAEDCLSTGDDNRDGNSLKIKKNLRELVENFIYNIEKEKTFVALKVATSLDGQIALTSGGNRWITGEKSRLFSHELRAQYDAVLVGRGTVEIDNPSLNIRHTDFPGLENKVVILDPSGELLSKIESLNIAKVRPAENIYICIEEKRILPSQNLEAAVGVNILRIKTLDGGEFDLQHLLFLLRKKGIYSVFVEGGAETLSIFLQQKKCQRLHLFVAPIVLGAGGGVSWTNKLSFSQMKERIFFTKTFAMNMGEDLYTTFLMA